MRPAVDLVTVGTELLLGETVDTNAARLGRALAGQGFPIGHHATVADSDLDIRRAVEAALGRSQVVIVTGGLGPTRDDITRDAVATLLARPLAFDAAVWQGLVERLAGTGRTPSESNRVQAMVPAGGVVLPNRRGTAPGLWIDDERGLVILLPGVPLEMESLLDEQVLPRLVERFGAAAVASRQLRTAGIAESRLGEILGPLEHDMQPVTLAYLPEQAGVDLRLTAWQLPADQAVPLLDRAEATVRAAVGEFIYSEGRQDLAAVVLDQLRRRQLTLVTAESCTGGMIGARITAVPGSSAVYLGGVVSYADRIKIEQLGVAATTLAAHGAVSAEVAGEMARGVAERFGAQVALAVTGIAGPSGGSAAKPVGTVAFGWWVAGELGTAVRHLVGDREQVRIRATQAALLGLWQRLGRE